MEDSARRGAPARPVSAFGPALWLGAALVLAKAAHWSLGDGSVAALAHFLRDWRVSSYRDVLFAAGFGLVGQGLLWLPRARSKAPTRLWWGLTLLGAACVVYAVASIQIFAYLRSPLTYPLLYLAGDMTNMRSSLGSFVSPSLAATFVAAPLLYVLAAWATDRLLPRTRRLRAAQAAGGVALAALVATSHATFQGRWRDRDDHLIVRNPHWVFVASCLSEWLGGDPQPLSVEFSPEDLDDFTLPPRLTTFAAGAPRPRNVVIVVMESAGARYLGLYGSRYDTTPRLAAEADHALVFDAFYSHVGLSANSLFALTLGNYPYMTWREYTVEYPAYPGVSLAQLLAPRGYRSAFIGAGDLEHVKEAAFLAHRGFDSVRDMRDLGAPPLSSWGTHDGALVDGAVRWLDEGDGRPFLLMLWTSQGHHPYESMPGATPIDFFHGVLPLPPDDYDLGRYLNTLRQTDAALGRLFAALRERSLAEDTLVVITGDHGEAFGDPHATWGHGARLYEENVRVPLMLWSPRLFPQGGRVASVGGHVDLNATVADVLGVPPSPGWQGRSLFDAERAPRTYFYAANDDYLLGVREGSWKYVYNATRGRDELYALDADPEEQQNLAEREPDRCRRLRRRLAAWRDHVSRQLAQARETLAARAAP
jgi:arylsulfatase A-like enzyme